jgi:hypothetical protein
MKESAWTKQICTEIEVAGGWVIPYVASRQNRAGTPDRQITHRLWAGWLEFKGLKTPVKPLQVHTLQQLNARAAGSAFVVRFPGIIQTVIRAPGIKSVDRIDLVHFKTGLDLLNMLKILKEEVYYE